ncbi:hypothetical protein HDU97_005520 [Phlyctochytrium planicorne]|nr:hypothetical protein HDU97_005520 [Phlyctochytrium planicorne]
MSQKPLNVLVVGTGEYTTGYVHNSASASDKSLGVICLVLFDARARNKVDQITLVGTTGVKNQGIRTHLEQGIQQKYTNLNNVTVKLLPEDGVERDAKAYLSAMDGMSEGDAVIVFTPDDTHFEICKEALKRKLHVLVAKPAVKTVEEHTTLIKLAEEKGVLAVAELHKRFDPIYSDARERIRTLGDFSYFNSFMSQPKHQLLTFKNWAGKSSDISYYLNSHHIDLLTWSLSGIAHPIQVVASAATGVATGKPYECVKGTEDTITLLVTFENINTKNKGTAVFTSSWIAPKAEVHSQQRFFYMGHEGEIRVDQAHRGYEMATDERGFFQNNPLFLRYQPDALGRYAGQSTYGHVSIETFLDAASAVNRGERKPEAFVGMIPTVKETLVVTAILEAGRKSLNAGGVPIKIEGI